MSIAFMTMAGGDPGWLGKWVAHNAQMVARKSDLIVLLDGEDAAARDLCAGCSVLVLPRAEAGANFEVPRTRLVHAMVAGLLHYHRVVVFNDVDEFLCLDPNAGPDLPAYLLAQEAPPKVVSPVGIELMYLTGDEPPLDLSQSLLTQRPYGFLNSSYCKPCIFYHPIRRGNMHKIQGEPWVIDRNIYLFHGRYADRALLDQRLAARSRAVTERQLQGVGGWSPEAARKTLDEARAGFLAAEPSVLGPDNIAAPLAKIEAHFARHGRPGVLRFGRYEVPPGLRKRL